MNINKDSPFRINPAILISVLTIYFIAVLERYGEILHLFDIYLFSVTIVIIFSSMITYYMVKNKVLRVPIWIIIISATFILLIFTSQYKYGSMVETSKIILPALLSIIIFNAINSKKDLKDFIFIYSSFGLAFILLNYIHYSFFSVSDRLFSLWNYPNTFAAFIVSLFFITLAIEINTNHPKIKLLFYFINAFLIYNLFLTVSRGAYIVFLLSLLLLILIFPKQKIKQLLKELSIILIINIGFILLGANKNVIMMNIGKAKILAAYAEGVYNGSLWRRIHFASLSLRIFKSNPVFGTGLGTFRTDFCQFEWMPDITYRLGPHSLFFRFLSETGLVGAGVFFGTIIAIFYRIFKKVYKKDLFEISIFVSSFSFLFHMCLDIDAYYIIPFIITASLISSLLFTINTKAIKIKNKPAYIAILIALLILLTSIIPKTLASHFAYEFIQTRKESFALQAMKFDKSCPLYPYYAAKFKKFTNDDALKLYKKASLLNNKDYRFFEGTGLCYLASNKQKEAIIALQKAIELYPTNPEINAYLSIANLMNGNVILAKKYAIRAEKLNIRKDSTPDFAKGLIELAQNKFNLAYSFLSVSLNKALIREAFGKETENDCFLKHIIFKNFLKKYHFKNNTKINKINDLLKCENK